jgi:hypothetical protein
MNTYRHTLVLVTLAAAACIDADSRTIDFGDGLPEGDAGGEDDGADTSDGGGGGDDGGDDTDGGVIFDVGNGDGTGDGGGGGDPCKVEDGDEDGAGTCDEQAPPDSFDPEVQWEWIGANGEVQATVTPLVGNFTDDDDNGEIDLCDIPDVVVIAYQHLLGKGSNGEGWIHVLDGASGSEHFRIDRPVWQFAGPAFGDIDDDGIPEIVAVDHETTAVIAFEHDGTLAWVGEESLHGSHVGGALGLADLDNDGDVEIYSGDLVTDHLGKTVLVYAHGHGQRIPTAADLDEDGDLEVITGRAAYHHDGTTLWVNEDVGSSGFSQVADVDDDGDPEVIVTTASGISVLHHDGSPIVLNDMPVNGPESETDWARPAALHDLDGDGGVELTMSIQSQYAAFDFAPLAVKWLAPVTDNSGVAGGTAFDFLGDSVAEAMYADETRLFVFDGNTGEQNLQWPRFSRTGTEYPIVADVDDDGSAEIVVVSNEGFSLEAPGTYPTVSVIRDAEDRWIQPRRIWNQHAYHVTNVREDGTIPQFESPNWKTFNTFRTNAQIAPGGAACIPPEG